MVGILSLIFGIAGILTSFFYVGIFLCIVGMTLGIVGLTDCFSEKNFPLAGLLLSILGGVLSVYAVVSDLDSGKLLIVYSGNKVESEYANMSNENRYDISEKISNETNRDEVSDEYEKQDDVPSAYKSALKKAIDYSNIMHMSKAAIYEQLISEYGEKFSEDAAQYALDNIEADWNSNALTKAKEYSEIMCMSKAGIFDQLISEYGERFTEEEAQYAVDNVNADWKANALKKAEEYQEMMYMSPEAI